MISQHFSYPSSTYVTSKHFIPGYQDQKFEILALAEIPPYNNVDLNSETINHEVATQKINNFFV